jgi:hypothetical protein
MPQNIAIDTKGWLSDFSDEATDAGIVFETRTALGMSALQINK